MKQLILVPIIGAVLLSGCSAPAIKDANLARMSAAEQAKSTEKSPQEVIDNAKESLAQAHVEDLAFYSPTYLAEAEKEIDAAERSLLSGEEPAVAVANALLAQQWINRGLKNKEEAQLKLKASLDALSVLDEIEAKKYIAEDYADFKNEIKDLIVLLEQEKNEEAIQEQKDILESFAELEVETLNAAYLKPVLIKLEEAEDQDADDYAEKTLADAQQQATALETYIQTNPRNRSEIAEQSKQASKAAMHAKQVALAARPLLKLNTEKAEKHVLAIERYIARIGAALNHEDVRHMSLDNQSIAIAQIAETTARRAKAFDRQQDWEGQKKSLTEKVSLLEVALATSKAQLEEARRSVVVSVTPASEKESVEVSVPTKETDGIDENISPTANSNIEKQSESIAHGPASDTPEDNSTQALNDSPLENMQTSEQADEQEAQLTISEQSEAQPTETPTGINDQKVVEAPSNMETKIKEAEPSDSKSTVETQTANVETEAPAESASETNSTEVNEVTDLTAQNN